LRKRSSNAGETPAAKRGVGNDPASRTAKGEHPPDANEIAFTSARRATQDPEPIIKWTEPIIEWKRRRKH
jgi:hypothetical protein